MATLEYLKQFFQTTVVPPTMRLSAAENIIDTQKFIESHLASAKAMKHKPRIQSLYLERLIKLKNKI